VSVPPLKFEIIDDVAWLTLNRPEAGNAVDLALAKALVDASIRCHTDASIRCVVLTGAGRLFCAGGDVNAFATAGEQIPAFLNELAGTLHMALARLARMDKPLLVVVNGPAAGAGLSLAISGDVVLAAESSHFTAAYSGLGLTPDGGMSWLLPRLVGLRKAQEIILTNRRIKAAEAVQIGMVTRTVADAELMGEARLVAAQLASSAVGAFGSARALLQQSFSNTYETHLESEARAITAAGASTETREGVAAYFAKRTPDFKGA
jgi:2-(1,2-epoxy-1,2-dihydrophenyl)acetyl-CoA isomerase